jgi:hypothetical protein
MTSAATPAEESTPQAALDAAAKATAAADAALTAAREAVPAAEQKLTDLEAAFCASDATSKAELTKARNAIEQARGDVEWSQLQLQAAEAAHSRAADAEAAAHRRVTADEYLTEHRAYNDPTSTESVLVAQLESTVTELIQVVDARQQLHHRLARELNSMPADEQAELHKRLAQQVQSYPSREKPLQGITTYGTREYAQWIVHNVPKGEVADAIEAGIQAARVAALQ